MAAARRTAWPAADGARRLPPNFSTLSRFHDRTRQTAVCVRAPCLVFDGGRSRAQPDAALAEARRRFRTGARHRKTAARSAHRDGDRISESGRPRCRTRQERRPHRRSGPRSASASSKSAPSRRSRRTATRARACSASRKRRASSTAWASTMPASQACWRTCAPRAFPKNGGILGINIGKNVTRRSSTPPTTT